MHLCRHGAREPKTERRRCENELLSSQGYETSDHGWGASVEALFMYAWHHVAFGDPYYDLKACDRQNDICTFAELPKPLESESNHTTTFYLQSPRNLPNLESQERTSPRGQLESITY